MEEIVPVTGESIAPPSKGTGVEVLAAVARRDITPAAGIRARNWGPADWDCADGVHQALTLTAVVFRTVTDSEPLVMIAVDGTWWRRVDDERSVRETILQRLSLREDSLLICLSHTHAGPVLSTSDAELPGGEFIGPYLEALVESAVSAVSEAVAELRPALVEWGLGKCDLASNRELILEGRAVVGYNPEEPADDTLLVGRITRPNGALVATIVNYACHPTTLAWQNTLMSPDYVGGMRMVVEEGTGSPCLFIQGASGELAPRRQYVGDTAVAEANGAVLGHAVLSVLSGLAPPGTELRLLDVMESGAPLAMWAPVATQPGRGLTRCRRTVRLPVRPLASLSELEESWTDIDPRSRSERLRRARDLRENYIDGPEVDHPVWVWKLGGAFVVAHPGEAYSALQTELRSRFPGVPLLIANLVNGPGFVYLPTKNAYEAGAYQSWQTPLDLGSLEMLIEHAASIITEIRELETE